MLIRSVNANAALTGFLILSSGLEMIQVTRPAPADPFARPTISIGELARLSPWETGGHRVKIAGTVTWPRIDNTVYLRDGRNSLTARLLDPSELEAGTRVELVGFLAPPEQDDYSPTLENALARVVSQGPPPAPMALTPDQVIEGGYDAEFVRMDAALIHRRRTPVGYSLALRHDGRVFQADFHSPQPVPRLDALREGSLLRLTGMSSLDVRRDGTTDVRIRLRAADDVQVLRLPARAWLEPLLWIGGGATVVVTVAVFWIVSLRKQVRRQTAIARANLEKEAALHEQVRTSQQLEAIGRLAGGVAHDFNNLITVMMGQSEVLQLNAGNPADVREAASEIAKAADRAAGLTRQLLAFSRRQHLQPKVVDLNSEIRNMDRLLRSLLDGAYELDLRLDPALGQVKMDPGQLGQVVMNLVVNARDAMPAGGTVRVQTTNVLIDEPVHIRGEVMPAGEYICLSVIDRGHGMSQDVLSRIFEPFFTTKEIGKGTGLGLSTVYGIVKQSGGHIDVASSPNRGATFTIYLPRVRERVQEVQPVPAAGPPAAKGTVLVVEDEKAVRQFLIRALQDQGYQVLEASNGADALALFQAHAEQVDLVLTDLVMPQMGGPELIRRLQRMRPGTRVVMMTGYVEPAMLDEAVASGHTLIMKPFKSQELMRTIRDLLQGAPMAA